MRQRRVPDGPRAPRGEGLRVPTVNDAVRARVEPALEARVVRRRPLVYTRGSDASLDRPTHVRAGSAMVRLGPGMLAVVQDDASFIAIVDLQRGTVDDIAL